MTKRCEDIAMVARAGSVWLEKRARDHYWEGGGGGGGGVTLCANGDECFEEEQKVEKNVHLDCKRSSVV